MKTPRQSHCSGRVSERVYGWSPKGAIAMAGSLQSKDSILPADIYQLKTATVNYVKHHVFLAILVAMFALPTVALGGSFVSSLIQGKTPAEAVVILGEQLDSLFGRVSTLETQQASTTVEMERLKLENENLRLQSEVLSKQAENTTAEVSKNKAAVDTVNKCTPIEKELTCIANGIKLFQADSNLVDLSPNTPIDEVVKEFGGSWYAKPSTDQICIQRTVSQTEECRSRSDVIYLLNSERKGKRDSANNQLPSLLNQQQELQNSYDSMQCKAILDEYAPGRGPYGCG